MRLLNILFTFMKKFEKLESRVKELESRLNLNSTNSGKPPSSDGYARKNRNREGNQKKKPGGQPGHKGNTLKQSRHPDHIEFHNPHECSLCGHNLKRGIILGIPIPTPQQQMHPILYNSCWIHPKNALILVKFTPYSYPKQRENDH